MQYDIEADWHLLNTCNYRCGYCFFTADILGDKLQMHASPQQWQSAFDATDFTWLLHMTGGEPSIYPLFAELCEALTKRHFISMNSNLSRPLQSFVERVDPSRVSFINAGFHFEERERRSGNAIFLENARLLRSKGFPLLVSIVATPSALARFEEAADILAQAGIVPIPKILRGSYNGQRFPEAYTEPDRDRFRKFAALAQNPIGKCSIRRGTRASTCSAIPSCFTESRLSPASYVKRDAGSLTSVQRVMSSAAAVRRSTETSSPEHSSARSGQNPAIQGVRLLLPEIHIRPLRSAGYPLRIL
jgi:MoaA/NifB/PqqE/SkfB family radical SAM enzyme